MNVLLEYMHAMFHYESCISALALYLLVMVNFLKSVLWTRKCLILNAAPIPYLEYVVGLVEDPVWILQNL